MENKKIIALTWWATWWHIFPLVSLHNYLKESGKYDFIWVWEEWWLEEEIAAKARIPFLHVAAWKLRRYFDIRNRYEPLKNLTWIVQAMIYIKKYNIDIVFSKWWYVSIPLSIAAKIMWKQLYIHESDTISWVSNSFLSKLTTKVFYTFPNEKIDWKKYIHSGQIINPEIIDYLETLTINENEKLTVIVTWWSQGSTKIFEAILKILAELPDITFHIILGDKNMHFRENFKAFPNTIVHDFITQKRLWKILKDIDIAITRAWATTLWELYFFWVHSIIVPLKNSASDHQNYNALYFKEKFWNEIIDEDDNLSENIFKKLVKYKSLRKSWLNIENVMHSLQIIEEEIEK